MARARRRAVRREHLALGNVPPEHRVRFRIVIALLLEDDGPTLVRERLGPPIPELDLVVA